MNIKVENLKNVQSHNNSKGIFLFESYMELQQGFPCDKLNNILSCLSESKEFTGKKGDTYTLTSVEDGSIQKTILVGLGEKAKCNVDNVRNNTSKLIKEVIKQKIKVLDLHVKSMDCCCNYEKVKAITESIIMTTYNFDKYKSDKKEVLLEEVRIIFHEDQDLAKLNEAVEEGRLLAEGNLISRELVNEPANILTPEALSKKVQQLGLDHGFQVEVYNKEEIKNFGMESFLSVGKGSSNEPKLIVMRYMGDTDNKENILGLVGKGLTFDAGGYCLKTAGSMWTMKSDMGGAGAVIGAMSTIARKGLKKNIVAVVAACENLISGDAYRPGDIINTMNGKTIEIINTDAEGRLTLVDAVTYIIRKENVTKVVDIATLTGAVGGAIGSAATGVVTNDDEFYSLLEEASLHCDERVWRFPTFDEYKEKIKTGNADLVNSTGPVGAGAITAGLFIGEFVEDKPWLHLDIAATAFTSQTPNREYFSKGATGVGARLLYEIAKKY
ncbi:MAG: leucyl aminopeptidase [Clostridium sulfidigenes]|uniref:Probable cytosol aminopeptidase n=1 Tax=Clostridium sulfidigenes TaxID=318464 RepID=A0A927ZQJ3_9CLOT|nr:leucyl aminopeptidase [Clostridium sulfidigenes]